MVAEIKAEAEVSSQHCTNLHKPQEESFPWATMWVRSHYWQLITSLNSFTWVSSDLCFFCYFLQCDSLRELPAQGEWLLKTGSVLQNVLFFTRLNKNRIRLSAFLWLSVSLWDWEFVQWLPWNPIWTNWRN